MERADEGLLGSALSTPQLAQVDARVQVALGELSSTHPPVLRVITGSEQPVSGAIVTALSSGRRLGQTGIEGEMDLVAEELGAGALAVMAEGFISTEVRIPMPPPAQTDVHLTRGARIIGLVLDDRGLPAGAGIRVMAVSPLYSFNDRALGLTLAGEPLIPLVQTDEKGAFVLSGLDPGHQYRLFAAGKGLASFDERTTVVPGPDAYVEVRTSPVFGVFVAFRDEDGRPLQLAPMTGSWQGSVTTGARATPLFTTKWTETLLGLDAGCNVVAEFYDRTFFYTAQGEPGDSISLRYRAELPGYAPIDELVEAGRAVGCLRRQDIIVRHTADGFGHVSVLLDPPARVAALLDSLSAGRHCKLRLREVPSGKVLDLWLDALAPAGLQVVDGIPHGVYAATLVAPHQLFAHPFGLQVDVGPEPVTLRFDLPPTGTLEMRVWRPDGSAYYGPLVGSHLRMEGDELDAFYFSSGPYRIPLLPNGEYRIVLDNLFADDAETHAQRIFVRDDGQTTVAEWRIPF